MHTEQLHEFVLTQLEDIKARDIVSIHVTERASFTDYMVICSGNSSRHVRSIAEHINTQVKAEGMTPIGIEGQDVGEWALIDLGDVIVHVMTDDVRDLYQLEKLWAEE
ncbi:ribosome silencing factor [Thalassotalea crassostreae]|uniref:ribosome silencing factor n=1 Tax=Thalassotalea crassostreae TaxID=1763536 RepID=UPI0008381A93|nr:ribosome silencing factor [Thalassotalea crassostreae]